MNAQNDVQLFPDLVCPIPSWLPDRWHGIVEGRADLIFSGGELESLHRVPNRLMSKWAEDGGFVALGAHGSDWSNEVTPHAAKIMDTWWTPTTREVVFCSVEQDGKTAILHNLVGGCQDMDPGPAMLIMPTEKKAGDVTTERLVPMFRGSRLLKRLVSDRADDLTRLLIRLKNGGRVFLAWANSADALSSWPIKYLFFDETDKYPEFVGKEANPITLGEKRVRTFEFDYKIYKSSTPSRDSGYIYKALGSCSQIWVWELCCTHCGDTFRAGVEHLAIPSEATIDTITAGTHKIHLACPHCGGMMTESERRFATRTGKWVCIKGGDLIDPGKVGFHRRAYDCKDVSLAKIAIAKLRADGGDIEAKIAWANGYEAVDYEPETSGIVEPEHLLKFRSEMPRNLVPPDTARLCLLADTQQASFYYEVWAYGYAPEVTMHMVRHGIVERFTDLEGMFQEVYTDHNGVEHRISNGLIDSGGTRRGWQKHSRTVEVYEWCSRTRAMVPIKGLPGRTGDTVTYKQIETFPGTNKRIPGGLKRANIRVDLFKDELERRLHQEPDDPGALSFHGEIDEPFARHYTGETKDEHGDWQHNRKQRIDYWDCTVYALALREMMKLRMPRNPKEAQPAQRRIISKGVRHD